MRQPFLVADLFCGVGATWTERDMVALFDAAAIDWNIPTEGTEPQ